MSNCISVDTIDHNKQDAIDLVRKALVLLGLHENQEPLDVPELDLQATPLRVVKMWIELTEGARDVPPAIAAFKSDHVQMLVSKDIDFTSLCSHHLVPFRGVAHVGYIPNGKVVGLSKPARVVDYFAARPQTQELLTKQVADYLMEKLQPRGVMVVLIAEHVCMTCRGARKPNSKFVTSSVKGLFLTDPSAKEEFLSLVNVSK